MKRKNKIITKSRGVTVLGTIELLDNDNNEFDAVLVTDYGEELYLEMPNQRTRIHEYADQYVKVLGSVFERDGWLTIAAKRISFAEPGEEDDGDPSYGYQESLDDFSDDDDYYGDKYHDSFD